MDGLKIEELSVEQKVGQMLLARGPQDEEDLDFLLELIRNRALGGIHISNRFVHHGSPRLDDENKLIQAVLDAADYPILICEDLETGFYDNTLMTELQLPDLLALGSTRSEEACYQYGRIGALRAKSRGYNLVFGPVMDIAMNPLSCCVGLRAFAGNKELVAKCAAACVRGYQDQGMVVTGKHYPGFGESPVDSHLGMVYLNGDEKLLLERELYPYCYCAEHADLSGVMTGHIMVPNVDPVYPASLSKKLVGMLRSTGYQGLIMTDSLAMVGLRNRFSLEDCFKYALMAGNDMVMADYRSTVKDAYELIMKTYRSGAITEAELDAAVSHVIHAQNRTIKRAEKVDVDQEDYRIIDDMGKKAVGVSLNGVDSVALDREGHHLFIVQEGNYYLDEATGKVIQEKCNLDVVKKTLAEKFPNAEFISLPEFPVRSQIEKVMAKSIGFDSVVMILFCRNISYTGSADVTRRVLTVMDSLRTKLAAVMLFGTPYAAREFGQVPRIIYGYQGDHCQKYAALTLAGEHTATGELPVSF